MNMDKEKEALSNNLSSPTESTNDSLPPYTPREHNTVSTSGIKLQSPVPDLIQAPSKILTVRAAGTGWGRWPSFSNEMMHIPIFENTSSTTTTVGEGQPLYVSTLPKRGSGSAVLRHAHKGDVLSTTYQFGMGRDPQIRHVGSNATSAGALAVEVRSATWSHTATLTSISYPYQSFKWQYFKTATPTERSVRVLALVAEPANFSSSSSNGDDAYGGKILAVLVRSDRTRTPGTNKWDAGNGGELVVAPEATRSLEESVMVASCLMMLKREMDRQRGAKMAMITGVPIS